MLSRSSSSPARTVLFAAAASLGSDLLPLESAHGQAIEQQRLTPTIGNQFEYFGESVATRGNLMVVGAPGDSTQDTDAGTVYVYRFDAAAGAWTLEQQLFASDEGSYCEFGTAVAVEDDKIVVTAWQASTIKGIYSGQAYVFRFDPAAKTWNEEQKLISSAGKPNDAMGKSASISGDVIVVGNQYADPNGLVDAGCAVVWRYQDPTVKWVEEAQLVDSNSAYHDLAGFAVGIDGDTIVVSSPNAKVNGWLDAGSVGVWTFDGTHWNETAEIAKPSNYTYDHFGFAAAISGGRIAVTSPDEDLLPLYGDAGWLHVYELNGTGWIETAKFPNPNPSSSSYFGMSLAMSGDTILVGHSANDTAGLADSGAAWLYRHGPGSGWVFDGQLVASDPDTNDQFGAAVAVSSEHLVAAASHNDTAAGTDWGVVYCFDGPQMNLTIAPTNPTPGQVITFSAFRGAPGALALITVEDVSGTSIFVPILIAPFGADDTLTFTAAAPNPLLGLHVGMRAYKQSPTGPLTKSALAYVDV